MVLHLLWQQHSILLAVHRLSAFFSSVGVVVNARGVSGLAAIGYGNEIMFPTANEPVLNIRRIEPVAVRQRQGDRREATTLRMEEAAD
jgi:hypothetical protein